MPLSPDTTLSAIAPGFGQAGSLQPSPSPISTPSTSSTLSIPSTPSSPQSEISNLKSEIPHPPSLSPHSELRTPHFPPRFSAAFSLFQILLELAITTVNHLIPRTDLLPDNAFSRPFAKLVECIWHLISIKCTIQRAPKRITPRQMLRLAQAAAVIARVTGRVFDFTPWTSLSADQLDALSPLPPKPPARRRRPDNPRRLHIFMTGRPATLLPNPGTTLARVFETLAKLLNTLPTPPPTPSIPSTPSTSYLSSSSPHSAFRAPHSPPTPPPSHPSVVRCPLSFPAPFLPP